MRFTQFDWGKGEPPEAANSHGYDDISDVWEAVGLGVVSQAEAWAGYQRNLEYVFNEVQRLIDSLDGKTVITSDHGNILSERSATVPIALYGYMSGIVHETLRSVPWAIVSSESNNEPISEPAVDVEERLKSLGYR